MEPNLYYDLFVDSFSSGLFVMLEKDIIFPAMLAMGNYSVLTITPIAFVATMIASGLNWMMGSLVATAKKQAALAKGAIDVPGIFGVLMKLAERYGIWLLLFSWIDIFGGLFALFAGVFGVRFWHAMAVVAISRLAFFAYMVWM